MVRRKGLQSKTMFSDLGGTVQFFVRSLSFSRRCPAKRALQILESIPLTTHASVALVRFEKEILMLGVTPQNVTVLARNGIAQNGGSSTMNASNAE